MSVPVNYINQFYLQIIKRNIIILIVAYFGLIPEGQPVILIWVATIFLIRITIKSGDILNG